MKRVLIALALVVALLLATAMPVMAQPPVRERATVSPPAPHVIPVIERYFPETAIDNSPVIE